MREALGRRTLFGGLAVLLLTTVHHVYGAYAYDTPWRLHVAHVSAVAAVLLIGSFVVRRRTTGPLASIALSVFVVVTVLVPMVGIGLFEGGYNHLLKNALYFGGAPIEWVRRLFPAPTYELPNDAFFELTGVFQLVGGVVTGLDLYRFLRSPRPA